MHRIHLNPLIPLIRSPWLPCLLAGLFVLPAAQAQVVISEVMANTESGQNSTDEYVELWNLGTVAVDLSGWGIDDDDQLNTFVTWDSVNAVSPLAGLTTDSLSLAGGAAALVLDTDYATGTMPYAIPTGTLVVTVSDAAIGNGLGEAEAITLVGSDSTTVADTYGTPDDDTDLIPLETDEGRSAYRVSLWGNDEALNWLAGAPTPGYVASVGTFVVDAAGSTAYATIGEALAVAAAGSTIDVMPGTYTEDLVLRETVTLGSTDGALSTVLAGSITIEDLGDGIVVDGFTLQGDFTNRRSNVELRNSTVEGGTVLYHYAGGSIHDNSFSANTVGIQLQYDAEPEVYGNSFSDTVESGVFCFQGSDASIHDNSFTGTTGAGLNCTGRPTIQNNSFAGFETGILVSSSGAQVIGNDLQSSTVACIQADGTDGALIAGNSLAGCEIGIKTIDASATLESNLIRDSLSTGIEVIGGLLDFISQEVVAAVTVAGNTVVDNGGAGLLLNAPSDTGPEPTVVANLVASNAGAGIQVLSDSATVANNLVWENVGGDYDGVEADAGSVEADPVFVSPSALDFSLDPTSPAVDAGGSHSFIHSSDHAGVDRVLDGDNDSTAVVDIGAFEFVFTCSDEDGDGFNDASCAAEDGDCDDSDAAVHPEAEELCGDSIDNDCNADTTDVFDADGDNSDCDVDCDDADATIHPSAAETWYDGVDQNCDGNDNDQDADGVTVGEDCDDTDPERTDDCDTALAQPVEPSEGCSCSASVAGGNRHHRTILGALLFLGLLGCRRRRTL